MYGTTSVAIDSIKFDLRKIGESVYEAHSKTGRWPASIGDLEGTEYLQMFYRREGLERGLYIVDWQPDLEANPQANKNRILAYDNGSLFAKLGWVYACRGDLSVERLGSHEMHALRARAPVRDR